MNRGWKNLRWGIVAIFSMGLVIGCWRWLSFYQLHTDSAYFRSLHGRNMQGVVRRFVFSMKFPQVLDVLRHIYPQEEPESHGVGHALGEAAYERYGARAFGLCDAIFNYGCYHGVVDAAIRIRGMDVSLVDNLAHACNAILSDAGPCIHPLGHASTIVTNYDLMAAYRLCDKVYPDPNVAFSCWNGVMMEYINRAAPNAPQVIYGDPNDPRAPCSQYPEKYEASCVSMHMSYLTRIWGEDYVKVFTFCQSYKNINTRTHCVNATGSILGQRMFTQPNLLLSTCALAGRDNTPCILGAIVPFVAAQKTHIARDLCDSLFDVDRRLCFERIASE